MLKIFQLNYVTLLKKNIVVSGSHGKTTITSLVSTILKDAHYNPTIVNGGIINSMNSNADLGNGVSKNPYLSIKIKGGAAGDSVALTWKDNLGESETAETKIKAK